jgi:hypothetical protein
METGVKQDGQATATPSRGHRSTAEVDARAADDDAALRRAIALIRFGSTASRADCRDALVRLRLWTSSYVRGRFGRSRKVGADRDLDDLADDATQHLVIALTQSFKAQIGICPDYLVAWCRRVVSNFVLSELRRRAKLSSLCAAHGDAPVSADGAVAMREALDVFIRELRNEVERTPACRSCDARLALVDEFLKDFLGERAVVSDRQLRNRLEQRRSRGRRVAREAWARLRAQRSQSDDLREIACALGLETETETETEHESEPEDRAGVHAGRVVFGRL